MAAGSFQINQAGGFGPWYFGNASQEWRNLKQAAFHVREKNGDSAPVTKTLAVNGTGPITNSYVNQPAPGYPVWSPDVMTSWPTIDKGDATYDALYPFGWIKYKNKRQGGEFDSDISTRFWSPIVAKDDRRSSMPVAYFDVQVANNTNKAEEVSVMFTFPNATAHVAGTGQPGWLGGPVSNPAKVGTGNSVRTGLTTKFDSSEGVKAVTMSADDPDQHTRHRGD